MLDLLVREMSTAADARVLVLGTYRDTELDDAHPLASLLGSLRKESLRESVLLRGLSDSEVRQLLVALARHDVPEPLVQALGRGTISARPVHTYGCSSSR